MKQLRPYQEEALKILSRDTSGLIASGMGVGKTLQAVEHLKTINPLGSAPRVLIVCPINTASQWRDTCGEQIPDLSPSGPLSDRLRVIGTPTSDPQSWSQYLLRRLPGIYIMGWEAMRGRVTRDVRRASNSKGNQKLTVAAVSRGMKEGTIPPWSRTGTWDLVIADEVHRMQRRDSANRLVLRAIRSQHRLALSNTPSGNSPEGLWSTLNWLWPQEYSSFWRWVYQHLTVEENQVGRTTVREIKGERYPGATWVDIPCKVRHRLEDVLHQLPEVIERIVHVPMGEEQRRQYDDFESQSFAWLNDHPVSAPLPVVQRIRLRQVALGTLKVSGVGEQISSWDQGEINFDEGYDQPKVKAVKDIIRGLPEDESVLVWTHSKKWGHLLVRSLNSDQSIQGKASYWSDVPTGEKRDGLKEDFINKNFRFLVAHPSSLSEGSDGIQNVCRCEIWASSTEDSVINKQATGRLHRPGQTRPVQRWIIHSEDSIDSDVDVNLKIRHRQMAKMYRDE